MKRIHRGRAGVVRAALVVLAVGCPRNKTGAMGVTQSRRDFLSCPHTAILLTRSARTEGPAEVETRRANGAAAKGRRGQARTARRGVTNRAKRPRTLRYDPDAFAYDPDASAYEPDALAYEPDALARARRLASRRE